MGENEGEEVMFVLWFLFGAATALTVMFIAKTDTEEARQYAELNKQLKELVKQLRGGQK